MFEFIRRLFRKESPEIFNWYAAERDKGLWLIGKCSRELALDYVCRNGRSIIGIDETNRVIFYDSGRAVDSFDL